MKILTNFGIPSQEFDQLKDDFDVLRTIIQKLELGEESIPIIGNQHSTHFAILVKSILKGAEKVVKKYDELISQQDSESLLGKRTF